MSLPYDKENPVDIERYAKNLIGKSFYDVLVDFFTKKLFNEYMVGEVPSEYNSISEDSNLFKEKVEYYNNPRGKGSLGNLIEEYYFFYKPNSDSKSDFAEANTELKVTPYELTKKGMRAGERLVIGMIPNSEPIDTNFDTSHVLDKLKLILLVLYHRDREKQRIHYSIDYVKLFSILSSYLENDLKIIKDDYRIICEKIVNGRAHELSESDTRYLGACTKGADAKSSFARQYYSDVPAKRRAFSLKQSYMSYIINHYIINDSNYYPDGLEDRMENSIPLEIDDSIFKLGELDRVSFDDEILKKIGFYKGYSESQLYAEFNINSKAKHSNILLINRMLGVKTLRAEEFEKANIKIKTIRVQKNGKPKESMSFPKIIIKDFVKEEFEHSEVYRYFYETRFLFVVFEESSFGDFILKGAKFWNMPIQDLEGIGGSEWRAYQEKFDEGVNFVVKQNRNGDDVISNDLPGKKDTKIFHLRPHANKSAYLIGNRRYGNGDEKDMDELPNGDKMTHQCFWLNNDYIADIIKDV